MELMPSAQPYQPEVKQMSNGRSVSRRRATPEADDIPIGVLDVEVFRAPSSRHKRLDDRCAVRGALRIERFDALNTGGCV